MKKNSKKKKLIICLLSAAVLLMFCFWQNNMITVSEYSYISPKVTADLDGFRIVHISDLHNKGFGKDQKRILKKIREFAPDIIVITGDIVDSNHTNIQRALDFAVGAVEIAPVYYVTGNHEKWLEDEEYDELMSGLDNAGVIRLDNESEVIEKGNSSFVLYGLDDDNLCDDTLKNMNADSKELNVLLAHEPQYITEYALNGADLAFSGHAHGGQFILPFIGGIIAPDQGFFPEYTEGVHTSAQMSMVISRGLGNSVIPVRLFNYPEIVCVTFECE